jgi:hypothetical protein
MTELRNPSYPPDLLSVLHRRLLKFRPHLGLQAPQPILLPVHKLPRLS